MTARWAGVRRTPAKRANHFRATFPRQGYAELATAVARVVWVPGPVWDRKKIPLTARSNNFLVVNKIDYAPVGGWVLKIPRTSSLWT